MRRTETSGSRKRVFRKQLLRNPYELRRFIAFLHFETPGHSRKIDLYHVTGVKRRLAPKQAGHSPIELTFMKCQILFTTRSEITRHE